MTTPNHPEYPAAHSCATSAAAETIKQVFGTAQVSFSYDSTVTGSTHHYTSVNDLPRECQRALHGGMHFRTSPVHGEGLGMQTAKYIAHHHFKALK